MERITQEIKKNEFYVTDKDWIQENEVGYFGEGIDKLAKYENLYDYLKDNQVETINELEKLRAAGKTKTITFRQLLAKKMMNTNMISLFEICGI